ncbi:winged helix-turn-helix transcriptional regulator [Candidatus Saccharibacteria bacterium]|nr:winged helix-turn-helix transcriptional regulator [Candidatus Saccharibacteria bacterium]
MVEYALHLDFLFSSLSDPTRRDILARVSRRELSVSDLVQHYNMSFAAISKHLMVMERAKLIVKRKEGRKQMVSLAPDALKGADEYLEQYRLMWQGRYDKLDALIQ